MGAAGGEGGWRAKADALREDQAGVVARKGGRRGEFVDMAVGVEDFEGKICPGELWREKRVSLWFLNCVVCRVAIDQSLSG